jgi:hypothetical protein
MTAMCIGGEAYRNRESPYTRRADMADIVTSVVELAVGLGCLAAAVGAWRRGGLRWLAALLVAAGVAATVHSAAALAA